MQYKAHAVPVRGLIFFSLAAMAAAQTYVQQGPKLVGSGATSGTVLQGQSVGISGDGNTAIVGGYGDTANAGAAWVFTRNNGAWTQQGNKLVGASAQGAAQQGYSVAISADGNTALVGGPMDSFRPGAVWVFTRANGVWTQQGSKLAATGATGSAEVGFSVALSADGNTAIAGAPFQSNGVGGAYVFTRSAGVWTQQTLLQGTGALGNAEQGYSVALSADGNTAIVGGYFDNSRAGAAWIFTRSGGVWTQQGGKLVGTGAVASLQQQGQSVALSGDGNTAIVGGTADNSAGGAAWVYTRTGGVWTQQGNKLVGNANAFGMSVALSSDGNTAAVGAGTGAGAVFLFTRNNGVWSALGAPLLGTGGTNAGQGASVSISSDASTLIEGGPFDATATGAAWIFAAAPSPSLSITKTHTNSFTAGQQGATYTVTVSNAAGAGTTSGLVSVAEAAPSGLTLVSMAGTGWACSNNTCTRSDALAGGSSYAPITVTVSVAANATSPQVNSVSVTGGGSANASTTDSTVIGSAPSLQIAKSHSGSFIQGQSGAYIVTVSNAAGAGSSSGTVTVTENPPSGLTVNAMSGAGWTCGASSCTRSDSLAGGASYPPITVIAIVASAATSPQVNSVTVSGGGSANATATDSTIVVPRSNGAISEFPIPSANSNPIGLTAGPNGTLWFTEADVNQIGRITTLGAITEFSIPTPVSHPFDIVAGPAADGALWFTEMSAGKIGRITTAGAFTEFPLPNAQAQPHGITLGPDGNLWFCESASDKIGRITTAGTVTEFALPSPGSFPHKIVTGSDGALWFVESGGNRIGRITTSGSISEFPIPTAGSQPNGIEAGQDGALWFTELHGQQIGRITTAGTIQEFPIPSVSPAPYFIAAGVSALWFTESNGNQIGRISTAGAVQEFPIPTSGAGPLGIALGADGAIWFTEASTGANRIGRLLFVGGPDLTITKTHTGSFNPGQTGALYTITVSNGGSAASSGAVTVADTLPNGLTGTNMSGTGWTCTQPAGPCTRSDALAAGGNYPPITLTVNVAAGVQLPVTNTATVSGGGDANTSNNTANDITQFGFPDLKIDKTHSGNFTQGQVGAFTLVVTNIGQSPTAGDVLVEEFPQAGLTVTGMAGNGWTCQAPAGPCSRPDVLAPGAQFPPITAIVSVAAGAASSVTNSARVSGGNTGTVSNTSTDFVTVQPNGTAQITRSCASLSFSYTVGDAAPGPQTCTVVTTPAGAPVQVIVSTATGGNWLSASITGSVLTVNVAAGLAPGSYSATVTLSSPGATSVATAVTVKVATGLSIAPTSANIGATGGPLSTTVTLSPSTSTDTWRAVSSVPWILIDSPAGGAGSGSGVAINFHAAPNSGAARTGTLTVLNSGGFAAAIFTVNQSGVTCASLTATPTNFTFGPGAGSGTVNFSVPGCPIAPTVNVPWLVLGTPTANSLPFTVQANSGALRTGIITINGSLTVNVTQTGLVCNYSIATHSGSGATYPSTGGTGVIDVTSPAGCPLPTATASDPFITVTGVNPGTPATVNYSVAPGAAARNGSITIAGLIYVISQSAPGQSFTCTAIGGNYNLRQESAAEIVGDILITCVGQAPAGTTGDFVITFNTTVANRLLASDPSNQTTDALLLKDFNKNTPLQLGVNAFPGLIAGPDTLRFHGVPLTAGGFSLVAAGIRVDASSAGRTLNASITGLAPVPITFPDSINVDSISPAASFSKPASTPGSLAGTTIQPLVFTELQAFGFRSQLEENGANAAVLGPGAGLASNATRLLALVSGVPAGVTLYAPTSANGAQLMSADSNGAGGFPEQGSVTIRGTRFSGYQPAAITNGSGTITWEVTNDDFRSLDSITFNLLIDNPSNASLAGMNITQSLGPLVTVRSPSTTAPIPRFVRAGLPAGACIPGSTPPGIPCLGVSPSLPSLGLGQPASALFTNRAKSAILPLAGPGRFDNLRLPVPVVVANNSPTDPSPDVDVALGTDTPNVTIIGCASTDSATCLGGGSSVTVNYEVLSPGEQPVIVLYVSASSSTFPANGQLQVHGAVTSDNGNRDSGGQFAANIRVPALSVTQTTTPLISGQNNTVAVSVANAAGAGDLPRGLIQIQYLLPVGVSPGTISGTNWTCNTQDRQNPTCTYGPGLNGGQTADPLNVTFFINPVSPPVTLSYKARLLLLGGFELKIDSLDTTTTTFQTTPAGLQFSIDGGAARTAPQTLYLTQADHTLSVASPQTLSGVQYTFSRWNDNSTAASRTITVASAAATYSATFTSPNSCSFSTDRPTISVPSGSGTTGASVTGTLTLTATNCTAVDTWTAVSDSPRLQVSPAAGNGATAQTTITYSMFTNSTTSSRVAHIMVAGIPVTLTQAGSSETQGQRVVRALYQTILGREPDSGGWTFWTGPGAPTNSAGAVLYNQMADGFYVSPEFKNSGWLVLNIYQTVTGSLPQFAPWLSAVTQIRNQSLTPTQLTNTLAGAVSNTVFINSAFQNGLARNPSSSEFNSALTNLNGGQSKFDFLNSAIFSSSEFTARTNGMLVQALYYTILVRDVDSGGFNFWLSQLNPPNGQNGIYYLYNPQPPTPQYGFKLAVIGQAVPPNPNLLGFLGSPEFQGLIQ